jgi:dephospho-CoA kinase
MIVIGLTGGIGMGKSTVAKMFAAHGIPAFNADDAVHALQAPHGYAIPALAASFPGTVTDGVLDRAKLRNWVLNDDVAMRRLEYLMHPLVHREEQKFRTAAFRAGRRAVILDIPLLFETGAQLRVDKTITVSAPRDVQISRIRKRGLDLPEIEQLIARQLPDALKRLYADEIIPTGLSKFHTMRAVRRIIKGLRQ